MNISTDEADEIVYDPSNEQQEESQHRWYTRYLVIFTREGQTYGFYHLKPATEMQEGMDEYEADPVPIFPVIGREVIKTVWEPA